jgi:hypothetical protein
MALAQQTKARQGAEPSFGCCFVKYACDVYFTTDWKSGEVSRLANWLSEEE